MTPDSQPDTWIYVHRPDTFSLGVCNGCQLMALLGWVPGRLSDDEPSENGASGEASGRFLEDRAQPRFVHNASGRFESRWAHVTIQDSPAVLLKVGSLFMTLNCEQQML